MDDALVVCRCERSRDLQRDGNGVIDREAP
jgi:hypothetical protein